MVDAMMRELGNIQRAARPEAIRANDAARLDFLANNAHQRVACGIRDNAGADLSVALQQSKHRRFSGGATPTLAFAHASKITFIHFNFPVHEGGLFFESLGDNPAQAVIKQTGRVSVDADKF